MKPSVISDKVFGGDAYIANYSTNQNEPVGVGLSTLYGSILRCTVGDLIGWLGGLPKCMIVQRRQMEKDSKC